LDGSSPRVRILRTVFFGCLSGFVCLFVLGVGFWVFFNFFLRWVGGFGAGGIVGLFCAFKLWSSRSKQKVHLLFPFFLWMKLTIQASGTFIPELSPPNLRFQPILQSVSTATINRFNKPCSFPFWGKFFPHNLPSLATMEVLDELFAPKKQ
jgi:hypothetical protein